MKSKFAVRAIAVSVGTVLSLGIFAGCGGKINADKDALVIMTEDLNELYNPFYSTAGTDMDVVGNTQISMLSTDPNGELTYGNDEPTVVLDYQEVYDSTEDTTTYYYVLKNGLKFSDGVPLTMNDVMFNLYVYLDPAYTGSTTMYSTDIEGLQTYRNQKESSEKNMEDEVNNTANTHAINRRQELINLYKTTAKIAPGQSQVPVTPDEMRAVIDQHNCSDSYCKAIGVDVSDQAAARAQLKADYNDTLTKFRDELESDFKGSRSSYTEEPYKSAPIYYNDNEVQKGFDDIVSFMYTEGYVTLKYPQAVGSTPDRSKIEKAELGYNFDRIKTEEEAINYVYNANVNSAFHEILQYWPTGTQMYSEFVAKAKDVTLHNDVDSNALRFKSISGIVSLGHNTEQKEITITHTDDGRPTKTYQIAQEHNDNGTPKNAGEYDVLRITIKGIDPKAKWNFGFTIAPYHYYSDPNGTSETTKNKLAGKDELTKSCWQNVVKVDIENNQFGVAWADFDFQTKVLQGDNSWGVSKNKVPLGAGPYIATDRTNADHPTAEGFFSNNIVYYKANHNFSLDGETATVPKIELMRYMETPISNALSSLESGQVHFVSPQFTKENAAKINSLKSRGIGSVDSWQLGYGYIGINASKVKQLGLRKAIMAAMQTSLALEYYETDTAEVINWPMSCVSWAYPRANGASYDGANPTANMDRDNKHDYTNYTTKENAVKLIKQYMQKESYTDEDLKVEFVIAGNNMYDHPAYLVFKQAMDILNDECGWDVSIKPDANALTKLSTGSLAVWAAAWGSTIDPDMYQVYHKNSTATSVLAWGYPDIKDTAQSEYKEERDILSKLSEKIDDARETNNQSERASLYKDAMSLVLDLAVELPLYQRKTLYAYNLNVIKESSMPHNEQGELAINPYTSPLAKIWEIEFTD